MPSRLRRVVDRLPLHPVSPVTGVPLLPPAATDEVRRLEEIIIRERWELRQLYDAH
ncbi:MAG: hypothetical protein K0U64_02750 [Actinomycetia bacterium]|nr:hypothetical protein [Actinomycetes bacterium]